MFVLRDISSSLNVAPQKRAKKICEEILRGGGRRRIGGIGGGRREGSEGWRSRRKGGGRERIYWIKLKIT